MNKPKKIKYSILLLASITIVLFFSVITSNSASALIGTEATCKAVDPNAYCTYSGCGSGNQIGWCAYGVQSCCVPSKDPNATTGIMSNTLSSKEQCLNSVLGAYCADDCGDGDEIGSCEKQKCCKKIAKITYPNLGTGSTNPTTGASPTTPGTAGAGGAGSGAAGGAGSGASAASVPNGGLVPCGLGGAADCTLCHLVLGFKNIYDYLLVLLLSATTLVVVVAGVMYMVSTGDKGMIDKAKSALTYALTAMILALTAWLILNATLSALGYTKVGSWYNFTCDTAQTQGPTGGTGTGTLPGTTGTGGKTGYPSGGNASATAQDVIKNYMAMDGKTYGAPFPLDAKLAGTGEGMNCGSTCREAWMEAGLPDFWNLQKQRWDGDPNSLKPGDICLFDKSATGIDHAFMILNQNGMTTAAGGSSNTIRTSANGLDYNISKLNGNSQGLYVFHIADYTK